MDEIDLKVATLNLQVHLSMGEWRDLSMAWGDHLLAPFLILHFCGSLHISYFFSSFLCSYLESTFNPCNLLYADPFELKSIYILNHSRHSRL